MQNITTWTIGLLDYCSILCSLSILIDIYQSIRGLVLLDYWTIGLLLYLILSIYLMCKSIDREYQIEQQSNSPIVQQSKQFYCTQGIYKNLNKGYQTQKQSNSPIVRQSNSLIVQQGKAPHILVNIHREHVKFRLSDFLHISYVQHNYLDYRTIELLLCFMFSTNTLRHLLEQEPLYCWPIGLLDYCSI